MDWKIKEFNELENRELYEILRLRSEVFVIEQSCIYTDMDSKDESAYHLLGEDNGEITAYLRILPRGISYDEVSIGRVLVRETHRRKGLAKEMLKRAMDFIEGALREDEIRISAQGYLLKFYESLGFKRASDFYLEDGIEHIEMLRQSGRKREEKRDHDNKAGFADPISAEDFVDIPGNIENNISSIIRKATWSDIDAVEKSYTELLLHEKEHGAYTVWELGVYPTRETAEKSVEEGSLYVMELEGEICGSIIANRIQPHEYGGIKWKYDAEPREVMVIHLLCIRPAKAGRGMGKALVEFVARQAKLMNCSTVRLDTGQQNKPAVALYTKLGFELAETASMSIGGLIPHDGHLFFELKI